MTNDSLQQIDRAICGDIWASPAAKRTLEALCQDCGHRFAGSDSDRRARDLMLRLWRDYGLSNVHSEEFPLAVWERGTAAATMSAPAARSYPCIALPYAPTCDLDAEVIDLGYGMEADISQAGQAVHGKIALVQNGAPPGPGRPAHRLEKYLRAKAAGAVGFLFMDNEPGMLAPTGSLAFDQNGALDQALPSAGIAHEAGMDIRHWMGRGTVKMHLRLENSIRRGTSSNIVGEIPGQDAGNGAVLMFGAHIDGHDIAQAANDNASGVVVISEVARVLAAQRQHVPSTLRFVCFGGEELGLLGSYAYASQHREEMGRIKFMFNLDVVGGSGTIGFMTQNASELVPYFTRMASDLAVEMTAREMMIPFSDHFPFVLQGVPAAFIACGDGGSSKRGWGHTAADTLEKVNVQTIRLAAALTARLALRLANEVAPWPSRQRTADEVKIALQAQGLEPFMRLEGKWPF